jgi:hypothetical protein
MTLEEIKARCEEIGECWEWKTKARSRAGLTHPHMRTEKGGPPKLVRRVAYELHTGKPLPADRYPVPKCGNPFCIRPEHQKALTQAEKDRRTGKIAGASQTRSASIARAWRESGRTTMTLEKAAEIRAAEGSLKALGARFGISASMVGAIKRGEYWRDHADPFAGLFTGLMAANDQQRARA